MRCVLAVALGQSTYGPRACVQEEGWIGVADRKIRTLEALKFVLKEADGLMRRIQNTCGFAQQPGKAICLLWDDVTTASYGVKAGHGLAISPPS